MNGEKITHEWVYFPYLNSFTTTESHGTLGAWSSLREVNVEVDIEVSRPAYWRSQRTERYFSLKSLNVNTAQYQ